MAHFLNGLVTYKRGKDESRPPQPVELPVTNNTVLKKIRVAFELKDDDLIALLAEDRAEVSKGELGAFFRRPDHRNYRECGDQSPQEFPERPVIGADAEGLARQAGPRSAEPQDSCVAGRRTAVRNLDARDVECQRRPWRWYGFAWFTHPLTWIGVVTAADK